MWLWIQNGNWLLKKIKSVEEINVIILYDKDHIKIKISFW